MTEYSVLPPLDLANYPLTHMVFSTAIGLPEITEKNWKTVYARLRFLVALGQINETDDFKITPALVYRHIGQQLNTARNLTDAAWRKDAFDKATLDRIQAAHVNEADAWHTAQ